MRNLLSLFQLACLNESCETIIPYDEYNSHKAACLHNRIHCEYCKDEILQKDLESHRLDCKGYMKYQMRCEIWNEMDVDYAYLNTEIKLLKEQVSSLQENNTSKSDQISSLHRKNEQLDIRNISLVNQLNSLEIRHSKVKNELDIEKKQGFLINNIFI